MMALDAEDDVFFADLCRQIALLIMDDEEQLPVLHRQYSPLPFQVGFFFLLIFLSQRSGNQRYVNYLLHALLSIRQKFSNPFAVTISRCSMNDSSIFLSLLQNITTTDIFRKNINSKLNCTE